jgi:uncharacterized protein HemX
MSDVIAPQKRPVKLIIVLLIGAILIGAVSFYVIQFVLQQKRSLQREIGMLQNDLTQQQMVLQKVAAAQKNSTLTEELMFGEIAYLIKAAHLALLLETDVITAIDYLAMAKQKVMAKPEFTELSVAIDHDLNALQHVAIADGKQLTLRIETLLQQLTVTKTPAAANDNVVTVQKMKLPWWRCWWQSAITELQRAVIIQHDLNEVFPYAGQHVWVRLNVQFNLLQAELSLVRDNEQLYHTALQAANDWLRKDVPQSSSNEEILKEIQALQQIKLQKPNVRASMEALHKTAAQHRAKNIRPSQ